MEEQKTNKNESASLVRPTKKQHELLQFIDTFIAENGYSPSYREIMRALNYTSVATVALHVNSLIKRGHIKKRDRSARSLEVVKQTASATAQPLKTNQIAEAEEKWLVQKINYFVEDLEAKPMITSLEIDQLQVLLAALRILGMEGAAQSFLPRVQKLKKRTEQKSI